MKQFFWTLLFVFCASGLRAQPEIRWLKNEIRILSGSNMQGRGYVQKGVDKAAGYISRKFHEFGLLPLSSDSSYFQYFHFPVNTFPGTAALTLQRKEMKPGADFIVNEASSGFSANRLKVKTVDLGKVKDSAQWSAVLKHLKPGGAFSLKNSDTVTKYLQLHRFTFGRMLPAGLFLIPRHGKLTWSVATDTIAATIFYVEDTAMPRKVRRVTASLENRFIPSFKSRNVLGYVRGTEHPDSFIVVTAHFDHLGKMGPALFPGAHDNASGTALMMFLARHFAAHPQKYSVAFIAFSGEEAGLIGSRYFVEHPVIPLNKVRFVINLDMTGDATNGITVVNAVEQKAAFALLNEINETTSLLPEIKERAQSRNSDHYYFSEKGVPSIFIYTNGTKPYYHDIFDQAKELSLKNIDGLAHLLIEFVGRLQP